MPEIKNTFLKGKMNKSLDDRLVPEGEFRDALNIQVTKNDVGADSNVGALHNIKGNSRVLQSFNFTENHKVIGSYFDEMENVIYWFITNGTDYHAIFYWNEIKGFKILAQGSFLNFSTAHEYQITGVNVLEGFLYWTDNLNQPRKINIEKAFNGDVVYDSELKVSVAKYAPYKAPMLWKLENDTTITSKILEENFVRFSYRYKYEDNEYSVLAPFSNIAFVPKDDIINPGDEDIIFGTSEVAGMINKINKVTLKIPVPSEAQIKEIELLYKESDSAAVRVIDRIKSTDSRISSNELTYEYRSTQPKSTLPEAQLIRVYDNVPITALAQEIVGNRIVYGNISLGTKYELPEIDYEVSYSSKNLAQDSISELKNHSIKQRRTYQVGIVLSDIFGRTSPVYLSNKSTVYVSAKNRLFDNSTFFGDGLKILFNSEIPNAYDPITNPLGWYSYKVVVKQSEQEYYNVYTSGAINRDLNENKSYIELIKDNVNKVPRDTSSSDIQSDSIADSKVRLYPKAVNEFDSSRSYPLSQVTRNSDGDLIVVTGIGKALDFSLVQPDGSGNLLYRMSNNTESPLLGRLGADIGVRNISFYPQLAVFETEPFVSSLDLYYETATSGLVTELNTLINTYNLEDFSVNESDNNDMNVEFSESLLAGSTIATLSAFYNLSPLEILTIGVNYQILGSNTDFEIYLDPSDSKYKIRTTRNFIYGESIPNIDIRATLGTAAIDKAVSFTLINEAPVVNIALNGYTIPEDVTEGFNLTTNQPNQPLVNFTYTDGSAIGYLGVTSITVSSNPFVSPNAFAIHDNGNGTGSIYVAENSGLTAGSAVTVTVTASDGTNTGSDQCVFTIITGGSGGTSPEFNFYYVPENTFLTQPEACANVIFWEPTVVYSAETNPMNIDGTGKMYGDSGLTKFAASGWYASDPSNSTIGKWSKYGYWLITPQNCNT